MHACISSCPFQTCETRNGSSRGKQSLSVHPSHHDPRPVRPLVLFPPDYFPSPNHARLLARHRERCEPRWTSDFDSPTGQASCIYEEVWTTRIDETHMAAREESKSSCLNCTAGPHATMSSASRLGRPVFPHGRMPFVVHFISRSFRLYIHPFPLCAEDGTLPQVAL